MRNARETWYDAERRVSVTFADVTDAAQALARGHLAGPTSAHFLARGLAAVALLGAETSADDEVVSLQLKCSGPLGGLNVECTKAGKLRGYTERKTLEDFDGLGRPDAKKVLGATQLQVTRSVPGRIVSQGVAASLADYLRDSLQRKAVLQLEAEVDDEVIVRGARGILVEALPDSPLEAPPSPEGIRLTLATRTILDRLGLKKAVRRETVPLAFGCRCSPERAQAMLAALGPEDRKNLPPKIDITCHMCGRTFSVPTEDLS